MDPNTIFSVAVGGLIAMIPIVITNIFQSKEREKDGEEHRAELAIQSSEDVNFPFFISGNRQYLSINDLKVWELSLIPEFQGKYS